MKILVCTDGSEHSKKALDKALLIAEGCIVEELAVLHVYERKPEFNYAPHYEIGPITRDDVTYEDVEKFKHIIEQFEAEKQKILDEAAKVFEAENFKVRKILSEGHPSETILNVAQKEGFDMIVLGSRGLGGLRKAFLGSVSNAVIQEAKDCIVSVVK